jgi:hypothetical protein
MYENPVDRWVHDEGPLEVGELGAGMGVDPSLCGDGYLREKCPNGTKCADKVNDNNH